jgi:hypothetical protein
LFCFCCCFYQSIINGQLWAVSSREGLGEETGVGEEGGAKGSQLVSQLEPLHVVIHFEPMSPADSKAFT